MAKLRNTMKLLAVVSMLSLLLVPMAASAQTGELVYEVTVTNLTSKQILSPPLIAVHSSSMHVWQVGGIASEGMRVVAEEGKNDKLVEELNGKATVSTGGLHLMPGESVTLHINAARGDVLSAATMLVQTNDAFTGLDNVALPSGSTTLETNAYDAGTEENTELAADVPGPPFNGHMHGTPTNPRQPIDMHQGITGRADVGKEFDWNNPVARYTINSLGGGGVTPGMPHTGSGDAAAVYLLLAAAGGLFLSGMVLRRTQPTRR